MTTKPKFKAGQWVKYHGRDACVVHVRSNGIWVSYEGTGSKRGQHIKERVSSKHLKA